MLLNVRWNWSRVIWNTDNVGRGRGQFMDSGLSCICVILTEWRGSNAASDVAPVTNFRKFELPENLFICFWFKLFTRDNTNVVTISFPYQFRDHPRHVQVRFFSNTGNVIAPRRSQHASAMIVDRPTDLTDRKSNHCRQSRRFIFFVWIGFDKWFSSCNIRVCTVHRTRGRPRHGKWKKYLIWFSHDVNFCNLYKIILPEHFIFRRKIITYDVLCNIFATTVDSR